MSARERKIIIRLHILKGRLDAGDNVGCAMEEAVWSKMPEDILNRVLLFLPSSKLFQFQVVCRKWRALLNSADFRKKIIALSLPQLEIPVVACVTPASTPGRSSDGYKFADLDLSFVPNSFWKSESYSVLAADDGLVCISDGSLTADAIERHGVQRDSFFCVINPLTRTCKVLPQMPLPDLSWLDTSLITLRLLDGMLTVFVCSFGLFNNVWQWAVANYDLKASKWSTAHGPVRPDSLRNTQGLAHEGHFLLYNGEIYTYGDHMFHVHSLNAGRIALVGATGSPRTIRDATLAYHDPNVYLAEHHGSIYFLAKVKTLYPGSIEFYGVWKLVRSAMAWELVSVLERQQVDALTRSKYEQYHVQYFLGASVVGDLLCLELGFCNIPGDTMPLMVGLNIRTQAWEVLHDKTHLKGAKVFKPRPDSLLL